MNADTQAVVFVLVWPVVLGIAMRVYVMACQAMDARDSRPSRARTHLGGWEC